MKDEFSDWEKYTGKLILAFGNIELLTFRLFEIWIPDKKALDFTLTQRLDNLIGHVARIKGEDEERHQIKELFIRTKQLNEIRNQLAHNPTILEKYNDFECEHVVTDLRGESPSLNIERVHELADETTSIVSGLTISVSRYTNLGADELIT